MADPRLDRLVEFDEKSKAFPIRTLLPPKPPRSYTWRGYDILDQGREGACVGFGWAHELMARPVVIQGVSEATALEIYRRAQVLDEYPGENYSGTSVIAGAKAVQERGLLAEYRWGFDLNDLVLTLGYHGPVVLGLNWYEGMLDTDENGYLWDTGDVSGGHCVLADSVNIKMGYVSGPNSWNETWGINGRWRMTFEVIDRLLKDQGEQCIPVRRLRAP